MLPRVDGFLAGIRLFAQRRHPRPIPFDLPAIEAALAHAATLAEGNERDEPAALFFACALRSRAFGPASRALLPLIARNQARSLRLELDLDDVVLTILHARIALLAVSFPDVRATFSESLLPSDHPSNRPPPRRPAGD